MTIHQQHGKRYFYFYTVLVLMALFTPALTAAELSGATPRTVRFELRLASPEPMKGWGRASPLP